jgi:hypothetical protein
MKEELTKEELALVDVTRDKWINLAFESCEKGIDEPKFEKGIEWLYQRFLELPKPQVVYCDSLIDAVLKITLVKDYGKELEDFTPQLVEDYFNDKLDEEFYKNINTNFSLKSTYIGWSNFGWVSFYDYFTKIKVIDNEDFNNYQQLIESNVFECFEFEHAVFAVRPPMYVKYNDEKIAHNIEGPSVEFRDGTKHYHLNGFSVSEELFTSLKENKYTFEDFVKESNEEIKSAVVSFIQSRDGDSGMYYFLKENLSEVNTYTDIKSEELMIGTTNNTNIGVYTLFKGSIGSVEIAYVRCYCPSTDRMFFLGVQPTNTNAKDAIASLYRVPKVLKENIKNISRQGEKFSTVFDEKTTLKLKDGEFSDDELKDYVSLTGEEYFDLMEYEY